MRENGPRWPCGKVALTGTHPRQGSSQHGDERQNLGEGYSGSRSRREGTQEVWAAGEGDGLHGQGELHLPYGNLTALDPRLPSIKTAYITFSRHVNSQCCRWSELIRGNRPSPQSGANFRDGLRTPEAGKPSPYPLVLYP